MDANHARERAAVESTPAVRSEVEPDATSQPSTADRRSPVNAFAVGDRYLLRHYFESTTVFDALEPHYDPHRHRFAVPPDAFGDVLGVLSGHGYEVTVVEDPARFAVAVRKYTDHPEPVFEETVLEIDAGEYNVFVLATLDAVERAVERGATGLWATSLQLRLPTAPGRGPVTVADLARE